MQRYATLPVQNVICRKLLLYNSNIVWNIKILLVTFLSKVSTDALCKVWFKLVKLPM